MAGLAGYQGDLTSTEIATFAVKGGVFTPSSARPAFGFFMRYNANRFLTLRGQLSLANLEGDAAKYSVKNKNSGLAFKTSVVEFAALGEIDFLGKSSKKGKGKKGGYDVRRLFSPYILLGVGAASISPKPTYTSNGENPTVKARFDQDLAANYSKTLLVVPIGGGFRINFAGSWSVGLEGTLRPTFSDYVDGISIVGNPSANDWFYVGAATVSYQIRKSDRDRDGVTDVDDKCPDEAGSSDTRGCPDGDLDGIADKDDKCPTEPGVKNEGGCPAQATTDQDNDGVIDQDDACPDMAGVKKLSGCPDTDSDGVADKDDACPTKPGPKDRKGCPLEGNVDKDGDGVLDKDDACPEKAGPADTKGCPQDLPNDKDGDGVQDKDDACPEKPGPVNRKGCPDTDGDGIPDNRDDCPDVKGIAFFTGCPDTDKDGVRDIDDKCPDVVGAAALNGCPAPTSVPPLAQKAIYFNIDEAQYSAKFQRDINEVLTVLREHPDYLVRIEGHTDNTGGYPTNQKLSERRAKYCYDYLLAQGVTASRMRYEGFGPDRPLVSNDSAEGRNQNRRVEFVFYK